MKYCTCCIVLYSWLHSSGTLSDFEHKMASQSLSNFTEPLACCSKLHANFENDSFYVQNVIGYSRKYPPQTTPTPAPNERQTIGYLKISGFPRFSIESKQSYFRPKHVREFCALNFKTLLFLHHESDFSHLDIIFKL